MNYLRARYIVTAFEVTDAPRSMAMEENMRSPYDSATASEVTDGNQRNATFLRKKKQLNLAALNVWTTNDSDATIRPKRATAIICKELEKTDIDICALSEVRRQGSGNIIEERRCDHGVVVKTERLVLALPSPINLTI